jgi:hypothetical protein
MLVALPGQCPAVLRAERLGLSGIRKYRQHTADGITCMSAAVGEV